MPRQCVSAIAVPGGRLMLFHHLAYWAKLGGATWPDEYHPVACHLIDVAVVASRLWKEVFRSQVRQWAGVNRGGWPRDATTWRCPHLRGSEPAREQPDIGKGKLSPRAWG